MQKKKTILTFQAPVELREELRALAVEHDRSLSAEVRRALREHVQRELAAANPRGVTASTTSRPSG